MGIWDKFYERAKSFFDTGGGTTEPPKSRCYYDLLEVSRDATEDEIKRSFKRLALQWHPDKNPDRAEECTAYFVLIQQAYEVLIDPQERAFYDRHRENIIYQQQQADPSEAGFVERRDTGINLEPFMSASCFRCHGGIGGAAASSFVGLFTGMAASPSSAPNSGGVVLSDEEQEQFFMVYRDLFHKLAAEEYAYIEDPEERNFPVFGKVTSDYDTVVFPFYAFWLDFTTRRSFAWLDKWDLRQAPDRPTARAMEKENRKLREQSRKQRSDQVRKVVEFVRRYDIRVQLAKERQRERNARTHQIVEERRRQTIRRNLENMPTFERDEEAHRQHIAHLEEIERALDAEFGTIDADGGTAEKAPKSGGLDGGSGDEEEGGGDGQSGSATAKFRCIVCEKNFNSKNVLTNHQRSKKHRQMVELLRAHMRSEDQQLFVDDEEVRKEEGGTEEKNGEEGRGNGGGWKGGRAEADGRNDDDEKEEEEEAEEQQQQRKKAGKRQRKQRREAARRLLEEEERVQEQRRVGEEEEKKAETKKEGVGMMVEGEKENNGGTTTTVGGGEPAETESSSDRGEETAPEEEEEGGDTRQGTKKRKGGKRTEQKQQLTSRAKRQQGEENQQQQQKGPVQCECVTCGAEFESKTKLHTHLRESGHAMLKTVTDKIVPGSGDGRRRRKKK